MGLIMNINQELKEKTKVLHDAQGSFYLFTKNIFAKSFTNFIDGKYIETSCNYLQKYKRTMKVAARSHFKSTIFYARIMSDLMFRGINEDLDIQYFSYNESLSGWHISQIKSLISKNPYFTELINLKSTAENVAAYTWDKKHIVRIKPKGIISFSRGSKSDYIYCDDLYSDPSNPIHPTVTYKISDIFRSVILEALKPGGEIHVTGSSMSRADIYFDPEIQKEFHGCFYPGIIKDSEGNEVPTWPEFYTLEQLKAKIPIMGERAFAAEIQCIPYYSTDSFFKKEQLRKDIVNPQLKNIPLVQGLNTPNLVIAGLDIGKKKHPSSLSIFELKDGKAIQIHQKTMVGWKYYSGKEFDPFRPTQVEYCREAIKNFGINYLYYDNTRGEFEGANDSGLLSMHFVPIVFTPKMKVQMATDFEKVVLNRQIQMLDDEEILDSICSVTNDLQKIESIGGHADCFDSFCLALIGFSKFGASGKQDKEIRVGSPSIFDKKKPPRGW